MRKKPKIEEIKTIVNCFLGEIATEYRFIDDFCITDRDSNSLNLSCKKGQVNSMVIKKQNCRATIYFNGIPYLNKHPFNLHANSFFRSENMIFNFNSFFQHLKMVMNCLVMFLK